MKKFEKKYPRMKSLWKTAIACLFKQTTLLSIFERLSYKNFTWSILSRTSSRTEKIHFNVFVFQFEQVTLETRLRTQPNIYGGVYL